MLSIFHRRMLCVVCACALLAVVGGIGIPALVGGGAAADSDAPVLVKNGTLFIPAGAQVIIGPGSSGLEHLQLAGNGQYFIDNGAGNILGGINNTNANFTGLNNTSLNSTISNTPNWSSQFYNPAESPNRVTIPGAISFNGGTVTGGNLSLGFGAQDNPQPEGGQVFQGTFGMWSSLISSTLFPSMLTGEGTFAGGGNWLLVSLDDLPQFNRVESRGNTVLIGSNLSLDRVEVLGGNALLINASVGRLYTGYNGGAAVIGGSFDSLFAANSSVIFVFGSAVGTGSTQHNGVILGASSQAGYGVRIVEGNTNLLNATTFSTLDGTPEAHTTITNTTEIETPPTESGGCQCESPDSCIKYDYSCCTSSGCRCMDDYGDGPTDPGSDI